MNIEEIYQYLIANSNQHNKLFTQKLVFTNSDIIGVKMDIIKKLAKELINDNVYLPSGKYLEYDLLNGLIISYRKDSITKKLENLIEFSTTIDNWSVSDTVACSTKFKKNELDLVYEFVKTLLKMKSNFSKRFGVIFLLKYFIDYDQDEIFNLLKELPYGDYYLDMSVAWYYSILLAKKYDQGLKYVLKLKKINDFVYKKSIQKAIDSFRINDFHKEELKQLRKQG